MRLVAIPYGLYGDQLPRDHLIACKGISESLAQGMKRLVRTASRTFTLTGARMCHRYPTVPTLLEVHVALLGAVRYRTNTVPYGTKTRFIHA